MVSIFLLMSFSSLFSHSQAYLSSSGNSSLNSFQRISSILTFSSLLSSLFSFSLSIHRQIRVILRSGSLMVFAPPTVHDQAKWMAFLKRTYSAIPWKSSSRTSPVELILARCRHSVTSRDILLRILDGRCATKEEERSLFAGKLLRWKKTKVEIVTLPDCHSPVVTLKCSVKHSGESNIFQRKRKRESEITCLTRGFVTCLMSRTPHKRRESLFMGKANASGAHSQSR